MLWTGTVQYYERLEIKIHCLRCSKLQWILVCSNRILGSTATTLTLFFFGSFGFELYLKCMSGQTTENGKFIMPFSEKMSYSDAINRCDGQGFISFDIKSKFGTYSDNLLVIGYYWNPPDRLGLQISLPESIEEQSFINALTTYSSNWLRIQFSGNEAFTNDKFKGENFIRKKELALKLIS